VLADEPVYIWRDATGAVHFSTVQETEQMSEEASEASLTFHRETRPGVAVSTKDSGPY
jgi:hypothetical protein